MNVNGIKTSFWGPSTWDFLFASVAGAYPIHVDPKNKEHMQKVRAFQAMMRSLQHTLPCVYCRDSYKIFLKEVPLSKYAGSRREMMRWIYDIHDKVNKKLMKQEQECLAQERARLMRQKFQFDRLQDELRKAQVQILTTKASPPFERVLARYERQRAPCNKKTKRC